MLLQSLALWGAMVWGQHVQTQSIDQIAREYDYRIEAGSARKPNKSGRVEQLQMALQTLGPILQPIAMSGVIGPMNALLAEWADSLDIDAKQFLLPPPPPPPQPPPGMTRFRGASCRGVRHLSPEGVLIKAATPLMFQRS